MVLVRLSPFPLDADPSVITGGELPVLQAEGLIGNAFAGTSDLLVVEADESDGSLVRYAPAIGVILNLQRDHKEVDEVELAKDFKKSMKGKYHAGDDAPGHVDLSFYGFLAGYLYSKCPIFENLVDKAELTEWVDLMNKVVPLEDLFPKEGSA